MTIDKTKQKKKNPYYKLLEIIDSLELARNLEPIPKIDRNIANWFLTNISNNAKE